MRAGASPMVVHIVLRAAAVISILAASGCGGIDLGDNPGPDVRKERGPLTVPPIGTRGGTVP